MSTPVTITIKIRKEDIGKFKKCNIKTLGYRTAQRYIKSCVAWQGQKDGVEFAKISLSNGIEKLPSVTKMKSDIKRTKLSPYMSIYVHWNGYPEKNNTGEALLKEFGTYEKALNLILSGDCSVITDGVKPYVGINQTWEQSKPSKTEYIPDCEMCYQYLFKNDKWYYRERGKKTFKLLVI
jgi:hypothetical protein